MDRNELEVIKSLKILGYKYLTRDIAGNLFAHKKKPTLHGTLWSCDFGDMLMTSPLAKGKFEFMERPSKEPLDIYHIDTSSEGEGFKVFKQEVIEEAYNWGMDSSYIDTKGICQNCGNTVSLKHNKNYCGMCGVRLDWKKEES